MLLVQLSAGEPQNFTRVPAGSLPDPGLDGASAPHLAVAPAALPPNAAVTSAGRIAPPRGLQTGNAPTGFRVLGNTRRRNW